ncbi:MAG: hypothetical protein GY797_10290 [Deltaproteobacteria bacterium]|nr:hypothetical protein [Deltaproteobacteria bacterium]
MPLIKNTLEKELEDILDRGKPSSSAEGASLWSKAYVAYASGALSKAGSFPTNAQPNMGILIGAFSSAFNSLSATTAASLIAQGIMSYWQAIVWVGPAAAGATSLPGNLSLSANLSVVLLDLSEKTPAEKSKEFADIFDLGAKLVVVSDVPFVQPAPPIVGPIS